MKHKDPELLQNIKDKLPALKDLHEVTCGEDEIYRFYRHSVRAYWLQKHTETIVEKLKQLAPEGVDDFNLDYMRIFKEGTGKKFDISYNQNWLKHTRPILEAYFHAKYFLEMAIKYGEELNKAPSALPSGWATLLYFYNMR